MEANRAAENLQTIRTLMERSALYRRALAPIMIFCGVVGITGGIGGWLLQIDSVLGFLLLWGGDAAVALAGAFLLARRQALKDSEPFWSPPTRRVVQALWPPLFAGLLVGLMPLVIRNGEGDAPDSTFLTAMLWVLFYGCAQHSAGFFMPRGIRLFGLGFILCGCGLLYAYFFGRFPSIPPGNFTSAHTLMGSFFGGLHLAYGIYLYLTEKKNSAA